MNQPTKCTECNNYGKVVSFEGETVDCPVCTISTNAAQWLSNCKKGTQIGEFGTKVAALLEEWKLGIYHLHAPFHKRTDWSHEEYIEIVEYGGFATFDNSTLTRLVLLAHKYRVRVEIRGLANGYISICLSNRSHKPDELYRHHPDIAEMLERHKDAIPNQPEGR